MKVMNLTWASRASLSLSSSSVKEQVSELGEGTASLCVYACVSVGANVCTCLCL